MASKKLRLEDGEKYDKYKEFVKQYQPVIEYIESSDLTKSSEVTQITHLAIYCYSQDETLSDLLKEAKNEEKSDKPISERKITKRLDNHEKFLTEEGYAPKTVRSRMKTVRAFYRRERITLPQSDLRPLLNPKLREEIKNSQLFQDFTTNRNLSNESTIGGYLTSLTGYCDYFNMSIEELIQEAEDEEEENVRESKRSVKRRLVEYRNYLHKEKYSNKTVSTKMSDITFFYAECDITIPQLGKPNVPYDTEISFEEVPKKEHVQKAIETTTSIKNRALFLFCMVSGSGSAEAREFTIEEYIKGVKGIEIHKDISDINIEQVLDEVDGDKELVPTFHFVRVKRNRDYYTCITPEANQFIINYLKTRENLTLDDKVFDYSRKSLIRAFQHVNDKNNWGWVNQDRQRFFTSHQLRRLNANLIDEPLLVNQIQGRKFDATSEAYFKRDPHKINQHYLRWLDELTIYEQYKVNILTEEKYAEFTEKLTQERKEKDKLKKKVEKLENDREKDKEKLINDYNNLSKRLRELNKQLKHINKNEPLNVETKTSIESFIRNCSDKTKFNFMSDKEYHEYLTDLTNIERILLDLNDDEINTIIELSYEIATTEINYDGTNDTITNIVKKAIFRLKKNPDLIIKVKNYTEDKEEQIKKLEEANKLIREKIKEIGLWDTEEEIDELFEKILNTIMNDKTLLAKDITEELVFDLIEENM